MKIGGKINDELLNRFEKNVNNSIVIKETYSKFINMLNFVLSKWKIIIIIFFIGGILGFYKSFRTKKYYTATMTFVLDDASSSSKDELGSIASKFGIESSSSGSGIFSSVNVLGLMKSRFIVEKTLLNPVFVDGMKMSFADYYLIIKSNSEQKKPIKFPLSLSREKFSKEQNNLLYDIYIEITSKDNFFVGFDEKKSPFKIIVFSSENEIFAKEFCENLVKTTSIFYIETKRSKSVYNIKILQNQIDSIRSVYNQSISSIAKAEDVTFNLNQAHKAKASSIPMRKQIDLQINSAMLNSLITNLEMSKMAMLKEAPLFRIIDYPIFPLSVTENNPIRSTILGALIAAFFSVILIICYKVFIEFINQNNFYN